MTVTVAGVDVGYFESNESHQEYYGYEQGTGSRNATGLDESNVLINDGTTSAYVFVHHSTSNDSWCLFLHYSNSETDQQFQTEVVWNDFNEALTGQFVFVSGQGVDLTQHGTTDVVFSRGDPVRNDGGGSFVYESGTTLTPGTPSAIVQDDPEDETGPGELQNDSYLLNNAGDPVTQHLYRADFGDGAGYRFSPGIHTVALDMRTLTDGRDDGQPLPETWVGVGPDGSSTKTAGDGTSISVSIDV